MFNLQTRIHFQKVEVPVFIDNKFNRTCRVIIDCFGECAGLFTHCLACFRVKERGGGFFNHLLMTPLNGTLAFIDVYGVAVLISQHLDFDVSGFFDEFFDKNSVITEA